MTSISIALIRQAYSNASADELASIEVLNLAGMNITIIDNLEVFNDIKELHLTNNNISCIESINFMYKLDYLDLSYNNIDAHDIVRCVRNKEIPSTLKTINLTGNPCANNDEILGLLQESYSELDIIIGIETDDDNYEPEIDEDNNDINITNNDEIFQLQPGEVLDSDAVLKSLVERKCQLDKLKDFNIDGAIQQLNSECTSAIGTRADNSHGKIMKSVFIKDKIRNRTDNYFEEISDAKNSVEILLEKSKSEKIEMNSFMSSLREKSLLLRQETFSKILKKDDDK